MSDKNVEVIKLSDAQTIYAFENGYGASVLKQNKIYGAKENFYELAVLKMHRFGHSLAFDTGITDDVINWLTKDDVDVYLERIKELPKHELG